MAAKFEICTDKVEKFGSILKAVNGQIIASGHGHVTKANA